MMVSRIKLKALDNDATHKEGKFLTFWKDFKQTTLQIGIRLCQSVHLSVLQFLFLPILHRRGYRFKGDFPRTFLHVVMLHFEAEKC